MNPQKTKSSLSELLRSLVLALTIVFIVRGFLVEAFKIPSGSMIPTLEIGDHLFVNKLAYGIRFPFTKNWLYRYGTPKHGEVVVFIYPKNEQENFIKRVVGTPGDTIRFSGTEIYLNGEKLKTTDILPVVPTQKVSKISMKPEGLPDPVKSRFESIPYLSDWKDYHYAVEEIAGVYHWIQHYSRPRQDNVEVKVPEGHLFVMGDNRDNSSDSRDWGFVPIENVIGRASFIWMPVICERNETMIVSNATSSNFLLPCPSGYNTKGVRWGRIGSAIR